MDMKDDKGNPFFHTVLITNACIECERTGDSAIIDSCKHSAVSWTAPNKDDRKIA